MGPKPKYQVTEYYLTVDFGLCHGPIDSLDQIWVKDQVAWSGHVYSNQTLSLNSPELFGGRKKEGGLYGVVDCYMGTLTQTMNAPSAARYQRSPADMPGYQGLAHFVFRGPELGELSGNRGLNGSLNNLLSSAGLISPSTSIQSGFQWISNNPYFPATWLTATRNPKGWRDDIRRIAREPDVDPVLVSESSAWEVAYGSYGAAPASPPPLTFNTASAGPFSRDPDYSIAGTDLLPSGGYWIRREITVPRDASIRISGYAENAAALYMNNVLVLNHNADNAQPPDSQNFSVDLRIPAGTHTVHAYLRDESPIAIDNATISLRIDWLDATRYDSNPAHIIRECLIDDEWGLGVYPASIDDVAFQAAADQLFLEQFGLAFTWTQQASIETIIQEVCDHIQAMVFIDPDSGLWSIKLIRGGYSLDGLKRLNPSNCKATNRQRKAISETTNEIVVTFTDSDTHEDRSASFQDIANIAMQDGSVRSETRNYYAIRTPRLAAFVGSRDLRSASYPVFSTDLEINTTLGRVKPGEVVLFSWPDDGIVDMPLRIYPVNYGKPGSSKMIAQATEDIFGLGFTEYEPLPDSLWQDPNIEPEPAEFIDVTTAPYPVLIRGGVAASDIADSDFPIVAMNVLAGSQNFPVDEIAVEAEVVKPTGEIVVERIADFPATPVRLTTFSLVREVSSTIAGTFVRRLAGAGRDPQPGDFLQFGQGDALSEIALLDSYNSGADTFTVSRGMFDTTPKDWPSGSICWYLGEVPSSLETSENASGAASFYRVLTINSGGILPSALATYVPFTPTSRPYAPHRPANARIGAAALFTNTFYTELAGGPAVPATLTVNWSNRNRLFEDTVPPKWGAATVTPETGQTTTIRVCNRDDGVVLFTYAGIAEGVTTFDIVPDDFAEGDRFLQVKLYAVRGGIESIQPAVIDLEIERVGYGRNYGYNYGG